LFISAVGTVSALFWMFMVALCPSSRRESRFSWVLHTLVGIIDPIVVSLVHTTFLEGSLGGALAVTVAGDTVVAGPIGIGGAADVSGSAVACAASTKAAMTAEIKPPSSVR
jgi:hypothetical protein